MTILFKDYSSCTLYSRTNNRLKAIEPTQLMLTKGDNNNIDDLELYEGLDWLDTTHVLGVVKGYAGPFNCEILKFTIVYIGISLSWVMPQSS
jgi:hypothetical protein